MNHNSWCRLLNQERRERRIRVFGKVSGSYTSSEAHKVVEDWFIQQGIDKNWILKLEEHNRETDVYDFDVVILISGFAYEAAEVIVWMKNSDVGLWRGLPILFKLTFG